MVVRAICNRQVAGSSPVIRSLSQTMVAYIALSEQDNRGSALYRQGILFVFIVFI